MKKIRKLIENFQHISDYMGRRQIATIAASTAFWFFLSIVPIVILCVSVLPYTSITEEQLLTTVAPVLPDSMNQLIRVIIADVYSSGVGVLSISIAATVWSSAMGFASLIRGLEDIYEQPRRAGFLMRRARGIIYTLGMLLMMILSFVLGGFGQQIKALVEKYLPGSQSFFSFLLHFRFVVVIALLTIFFAAIFRWSTGLRPRFGEVLPGALTAAVGWSIFSWAFSAWVSATGSYGTYGSLVTVVLVSAARRELWQLRMLGLSSPQGIVGAESLLLGLFGGVLGAGAAWALCTLLGSLGGAALSLPWQTAGIAALAAALLSWLSGRLGASGARK